MEIEILITPSCMYREGTSGKGNPYCMAEAFAVLPGVDFPQKFSYYCKDRNEVLPQGEYLAPVSGEVKDGRLVFNVDPRQARKKAATPKPAAVSNSPAPQQNKTA